MLSAGYHHQQVALSPTGELRESGDLLLEVVLHQRQRPWVFMCPSHQCWWQGMCGPPKISEEEMQGLKVGVGWGALSNPTAGRGPVSDACLTPLPGPQPDVGLSSLHPLCIMSVLRLGSGLSLNRDVLAHHGPGSACLCGVCQVRTELTAGHSKPHRSGAVGAAGHCEVGGWSRVQGLRRRDSSVRPLPTFGGCGHP